MSENTTIIMDPSNKPLGKLVETDQYITARTMAGVSLARYDKSINQTFDMSGRPLARGNVVTSYLFKT